MPADPAALPAWLAFAGVHDLMHLEQLAGLAASFAAPFAAPAGSPSPPRSTPQPPVTPEVGRP
jgi:hypothetical protein